jgi:mannose-6-phosphate isomerase
MQTYLERFTGEVPFENYGTQFPVMVKWLDIKGRTSLHVNPDDEAAEQRYDAFGKTALWYVAATGPDAKLYLGFKRDVTATEFYEKCLDGTVEELLNVIKPKVGEHYLVTPGMVHAAQDVRLLEVAESSELWFRLHAWGDTESELHLEEAFDLIDFKAYRMPRPSKGNPEAVMEKLAVTPQFTVNEIRLRDAVRVTDQGGSFRLYACVRGAGAVEVDGMDRLRFKEGDAVLVPAELKDFVLVPTDRDTLVLEALLEPRHEPDAYIDPSAEPFLKGEEYDGLSGDELPDPELS